MFRNGRSVSEEQEMQALCASHHTLVVTLTLLNLDMVEIAGGDISARLDDGQVTFDADAAISRALSLDLLDPTGALHLDTNSPDNGAMFADRMIRVKYTIINPLGTKRYTTPIFTGPIVSMDRNGDEVKIECQGKEIFGLAPAWNEKTFRKGANLMHVIRFILTEMMGETHLDLPKAGKITKKKLPRNVSVGGDKLPWLVAKELARSAGWHLYFTGEGVCKMRPIPRKSVFSFIEGPGGTVKSEPEVGFNVDKVINAVEVWGKKPTKAQKKRGKRRPHAKAVAPRAHPLSPWKLGRKGGPRFLPKIIEDDGITTKKEAGERARRELRNALFESVEVAYDTVTIPSLEEIDVVTVKTSKFTADHRARKFAIGLRSASDTPMGYVRNVKPNVSRIRAKR